MKIMQKLKSYTHVVAILLVVPMLAISCGGNKTPAKSDKVVLTVWKPFADEGTMKVLFDAYHKEHPNVSFEYSKRNIETYEEDLLNALAAGQGPDIFSINNTWLPKYLDKVTPVDEKKFSYKDYREAFVDVVIKDFTKDQKIYGTALSVDSLALYYNKDILGTVGITAPPKSWAELERNVRDITAYDKTGYFARSGVAIGTSANVNRAQDIVALMMMQAGATPWSADGLTPQFGSNEAIKGFEFYLSFANPASENYNWNERSDYSIDAFANGRTAFLYSYNYAREQILAKSPNLNFDISAVPQENLNNTSVNFANYFGEVVNKQSKNVDVAWDFLKFATSKDALDKYYAKNKQPSSRKDLIALQIQDLEIGVFAHANLTAKSFYKPDEAKMNAILNRMIDNVVKNGMNPKQAVGQAMNEARTIIRR